MTTLCKTGAEFSPHAGFQRNVQSLKNTPARCIRGGLRVLSPYLCAQHHLHMTLRLHGPPIRPNAISGLPPLVTKPGMMVWNGRLDGPNSVRVSALERKTETTILQADAGFGDDDAGTEARIVGLDIGHHHAGFVGDGKANRAAMLWRAGSEVLSLRHLDQAGPACEVIRIEEVLTATSAM